MNNLWLRRDHENNTKPFLWVIGGEVG